MFIFDRDRECVSRGEAERGGQRIWSRLYTDSREPDVGLKPMNHEIMTWAKIKSRTLNQLSHPGAPIFILSVSLHVPVTTISLVNSKIEREEETSQGLTMSLLLKWQSHPFTISYRNFPWLAIISHSLWSRMFSLVCWFGIQKFTNLGSFVSIRIKRRKRFVFLL